MSKESVKVYDAENMVVGRLGAKAAKAAILGEHVVVVNAEKAIITGDRRTLIEAWKERFNIRTSYKPSRGPFHERRPDKMVRKMFRGMLPWPTPRGKNAYKPIKVYIGVPKQFAESKKIILEGARYRSLKRKFITVADLSHELGWRNPEVVK